MNNEESYVKWSERQYFRWERRNGEIWILAMIGKGIDEGVEYWMRAKLGDWHPVLTRVKNRQF